MNSKAVGNRSEATILAALVARGYRVSVPFGDNEPYDLVVDARARLRSVQVKTGWLEDGCVRFKTGSKTTQDGAAVVVDYEASDVDAFAVRCRDTEALYWVPYDDDGRKSTYLRVEDAAIDHPAVNDAAAYRFDTNLPPT